MAIDTISFRKFNGVCDGMLCEGMLNKERTGGLEFTWGNADACLTALHQMAVGKGFGVIVGQGMRAMKRLFAKYCGADPDFLQDIGMEVKGMEISEYMTKESLTQQGGYAMASKGGQHDEAWLIFMELVHKQLPTFEKKAEALVLLSQCGAHGSACMVYANFPGTTSFQPAIKLLMNPPKSLSMWKIIRGYMKV